MPCPCSCLPSGHHDCSGSPLYPAPTSSLDITGHPARPRGLHNRHDQPILCAEQPAAAGCIWVETWLDGVGQPPTLLGKCLRVRVVEVHALPYVILYLVRGRKTVSAIAARGWSHDAQCATPTWPCCAASSLQAVHLSNRHYPTCVRLGLSLKLCLTHPQARLAVVFVLPDQLLWAEPPRQRGPCPGPHSLPAPPSRDERTSHGTLGTGKRDRHSGVNLWIMHVHTGSYPQQLLSARHLRVLCLSMPLRLPPPWHVGRLHLCSCCSLFAAVMVVGHCRKCR